MKKSLKFMFVQFGRLCLALTLLAGLLFRSAWVETALADEEGPLAPLAAGDGLDNYADLAIGVPGEDRDNNDNGVTNIIYGKWIGLDYGSDTGIQAITNAQVWSQDTATVPDEAEATDGFGYSLATGDFNNDFYDDLVVGVPYESLGHAAAGAIHVIYGSAGKLTTAGNQMFSLDEEDMGDSDHFGWSLAAGRFNGDQYDDLAIGAPGKTIDGKLEAGQVTIMWGLFSGLVMFGAQTWSQADPGIFGEAEAYDHYGWSLAALELDSYRTFLPLVFQKP
jgi:hypothetical protein